MSPHNLAPQIISRLMSEVREVVKSPPEGVEILLEEDSSVSEIHAIISGPEETPFYGGKFRMKLIVSEEYPSVPPKGYFLTKIFHPNISVNGDICVNTLKRDWTSQVSLKHILQVIRCLLIIPFPESSLNDEAGKLFMESYNEYYRRAKIMTEVHSLDYNPSLVNAASSSSSTKLDDTNKENTTNNNIENINDDFNTIEPSMKKKKDIKKKTMSRI